MMLQTKAAAGLEYKFTKFAATDLDAATGQFRGYASTFGNEDQGGDIVVAGAFSACLAGRDARQVKMLYEHNCYEPVGVWTELKEDDHGLLATGRLLFDKLKKAQEVYDLMKEGVLDSLSIGYRVIKADSDRSNPHVRLLKSVDLKEISVVMFPMNENAVIDSVKASLPTEREFQRLLQRDAQLSRSEAAHVVKHGFLSLLKSKRDAAGEVASRATDPAAERLLEQLQGLSEAFR